MAKYPRLQDLSLPELETLRNLINDGTYDGNSTENIKAEARGFQYGHEAWKEALIKRNVLLAEIDTEICQTIKTILND
jgi:hypothetical protein